MNANGWIGARPVGGSPVGSPAAVALFESTQTRRRRGSTWRGADRTREPTLDDPTREPARSSPSSHAAGHVDEDSRGNPGDVLSARWARRGRWRPERGPARLAQAMEEAAGGAREGESLRVSSGGGVCRGESWTRPVCLAKNATAESGLCGVSESRWHAAQSCEPWFKPCAGPPDRSLVPDDEVADSWSRPSSPCSDGPADSTKAWHATKETRSIARRRDRIDGSGGFWKSRPDKARR